MSAILRVRDENGNVHDIPAIVGPPGPQGPQGPAGSGTGDMTAEVYDPQGKAQDIFKYVDEKLKDVDFDVTADEVKFADGETFQQKYDSGDLTGPQGPTGPAGKDGQDGQPGATGAAGQPGAAGKNATINGVNALTIGGSGGVAASQSGSQLNLSVSGTFGGQAVANSAGQTPGMKLIRNSKLLSASAFDAVTDWTSHITNGEIAWRYE